jgi:hypothetical protein
MQASAASGSASSGISGNRRHGRKEKRRRAGRHLLFESLEARHLLAAWVDSLQLLNDTGSSPTDLVTSDPQVTGTVQGDFTGGYVEVQFDHFANGYMDGYVYAYEPGQQFTYDPRWYDYSLDDYAGSFTLNYRTVEYDSSYTALTGAWQSCTFTLEVPAAPEISVSYWDAYYGYQQEVYSGYSSVPFPETPLGTPVATTLAIYNHGTADLVLDTASLTLPTGFSLASPFASSVVPGGSTNFTIQLDAASSGYFQGTVALESNDPNQNPFEFYVYGDVRMPQPEISVVQQLDGYTYVVDSGWGWISFGSTTVGTPVDTVLTIVNHGQVRPDHGRVVACSQLDDRQSRRGGIDAGSRLGDVAARTPGLFEGGLPLANQSFARESTEHGTHFTSRRLWCACPNSSIMEIRQWVLVNRSMSCECCVSTS